MAAKYLALGVCGVLSNFEPSESRARDHTPNLKLNYGTKKIGKNRKIAKIKIYGNVNRGHLKLRKFQTRRKNAEI